MIPLKINKENRRRSIVVLKIDQFYDMIEKEMKQKQ
jgi:hypothetical protein